MTVAIINYCGGNTFSVVNALHRLGIEPLITNDAGQIAAADKIILPGVGAAQPAMTDLVRFNLHHLIPTLTQPFLGICVGMQVLCTHSAEDNARCLGVFNQPILRFENTVKVPQMGWNALHKLHSPLFNHVAENAYVYFANSYYAPLSSYTIAQANYEMPYSAALCKNNFHGIQFHAEKSGAVGEQILKNFLSL